MNVPQFRAWDRKLKTMRRGLFVGSGRVWDAYCRTPRPHLDITKECELMMSTPVLDRQNEVTFEFDIVKHKEKLYAIKYHYESASWILKPLSKWGETQLTYDEIVFLADAKKDTDFEIMGNVFESIELMMEETARLN